MPNSKSHENLKLWIPKGSVAALLITLTTVLAMIEFVPAMQMVFSPSRYLPFHTFIEMMSAIVAGLIFSVGWHSYQRERPGAITILACAFLAVGLLDIGHMISYNGMPDFLTPSSPPKAIYFWLAAKLVLASALVLAASIIWKPLEGRSTRWWFLSVSIAITITVYWMIINHINVLPQVFIAGQGLTPFKVGTEYLIVSLHILTIYLLMQNRVQRHGYNTRLLAVGVVILILSEWCFTRYTTVTDTWHVIGHLYKILGYGFVYYAIFVSSIRAPYLNLHQSEARAVREKSTTQATLNAIGDAVITIDLDGNIDYLNPAAQHMLGVVAGDVIGCQFSAVVNIINEKAQNVVAYPLSHCLSGVAVQNQATQLLLVRKDGLEIPIDDTATPVLDSEGKVTGAVITFKDVGERRRAQKALWQSEHMFHDLLEFAPDAIVISDAHGHISVVNGQAEKVFGYTRDELVGKPIEILIPSRLRGDHDRYRKNYHGQPHPRPMGGAGMEIFCVRKDGTEFPGDISLGPLETAEGRLVMAVVRDVTERRRLEAQTRESARYARSLIEASLDPLVTISSEGTITDVNQATELATGLARDKLVGSDFASYFTDPQEAREGYMHAFVNGIVRDWPLTLRHESGKEIDVLYNASVYRDESGDVLGVFAAARDVTERKQFELQLSHQATHDALTGLPNRTLLQDRLNQAIVKSQREGHSIAVMFMDLDNFKQVNDTLGHAVGDGLLCGVAERVRNVLREGDTVARFGGDEYVVLLQDVAGPKDLDAIARKILEAISLPFDQQGSLLYANASMGITVFPKDGDTADELLRNADTAMYVAKDQGRNTYRYFSAEMDSALLGKLELGNQLRQALQNNEFVLYYQPKVNLGTGEVSGMEALIRWNHPQKGKVPPGLFIPVAEECGLIVDIGLWVINEACRQIRQWLNDGLTPGRVAINLSAAQCRTNEVIGRVREALAINGLQGEILEVEVTESMMMQDTESAIRILLELKRMGVNVAIDDFGTGYSSLSYLKRFPIDCLKVDKSFVDDIEFDPNDCEIVLAIIGMAHGLGLKVVAEGVETEAQLEFLRQNGCDEMQGYLFSKPLPGNELANLISQGLKMVPENES